MNKNILNNHYRLLIPIMIFILLIVAFAFRYNIEASKTESTGVIKWERDRWTGDLWLKAYVVDKDGVKDVVILSDSNGKDASAEDEKQAVNLKKSLTAIWSILLILNLGWMIYLICFKRTDGAIAT